MVPQTRKISADDPPNLLPTVTIRIWFAACFFFSIKAEVSVMNRFFVMTVLGLTILLTIAAPRANPAIAQDTADADRERLTTERFLDVLLKRPRPGTALDRVYGFHVQAGTLDELLSGLAPEKLAAATDPGAAAMLRGLILSRRGNDAEAAIALADAEKLLSNDAMASYYLGKTLLQIGRSDAAAAALQRSIDRGPAKNEALPVFTELGRLYQRAQQSEKARQVWQQLEATFPGDARVGQQIASTLAEEGQFDAALERYERLAKAAGPADDPRVIEFRILAAEMKQRLGRSEDALADFEAIAGRLRPASWLYSDVRRRIESVFLRSGDYSALADYYAALVEKRPDEIALRLRLGQSLAKAGRINDAEAALRETVAKAPEDAQSRLALIDIFKAAGKPDQAAEQFEQLVKLDSENPDYLIQLGNTWLDVTSIDKDARREKAAAAWQKLATARKSDPVVIAQVADLMRRIERDEQATRLYRQAIDLAPDQPQYREYLGEFLHRQKRTDEALEVWAGIAAPPRDDRDNLIRLAEVLNTFEQPERALETFLKAAELDLTFAQRLRLAELLSRATRYDESLAQLDQADAVAETPEERDQILQSRIGVYAAGQTLGERIAEAQKAAETSKNAEDYRKLSLMLDAAARLTEATAAIESALASAPDDTSSLAIAAELYRKASRLGDAVETYRKLAKQDQRFLPNYLKRISGLQLQLGQANESLATAAELIDAQPGNPESYRFYAEQCFKLGRDDEAIQTLRRALRAAPRDRDTRQTLASALANRFKTDEAIELYWELVEDSQAVDEQKRFVSLMAPLYEQKGDYQRLVARIELRGREASDMRTAMLLASAAHRAVNDLGAARQSLEPLLAENARDAELLVEIVSLAEASSEPEVALQYQQQLLAMADTPENRGRALKLMVDSGQIEAAEAALQRLREIDDPVVMIEMLDRTTNRGDYQAAIRISETILDQQQDLWEVRLRLAALLLVENKPEESLQQVAIIESLNLPPDTPSVSTKAKLSRLSPDARAQQQMRAANFSPFNYNQDLYQLAQFLRVGRYGSRQYSFGGASASALAAYDYQHGRFLATAIRVAESAKRGKLDEATESDIDESKLDSIDDANLLWTEIHKETLRQNFAPTDSVVMVTRNSSERASNLMWRLAELDEKHRSQIVSQQLSTRASMRNPRSVNGLRFTVIGIPLGRLSDLQLDLACDLVKQNTNSAASQLPAAFYSGLLHNELVAAGRTGEAAELAAKFESAGTTPLAISETMRFYLSTKMYNRIPAMIRSLKTSLADSAPTLVRNELTALGSIVNQVLASEGMPIETKLDCIDLMVAIQAINQAKATATRQSPSNQGVLNVGYSVNGRYQQVELSVPFSNDLLPSNFAQAFYQATKFQDENADRKRMIAHLGSDAAILSPQSPEGMRERKYRMTLEAFSHWWANNLPTAMERIVAMGQQYPDDQDLAIERARLAAELNRPQAALEALESIQPTDQATLRVREIAAMNLAVKLGKLDRAKEAAERLFGMRLDVTTEMALADQMTRMGMNDLATAVLQRSQRRGGQSVTDSLQVAQRFIAAGDKEAAAEVAYRSLRQLSSQPSSNNQYYKQQAVQLLRQVGRLDKLLEQAERRVAATPKSMTLKSELAELYTAAGRSDDASKLFDEVAKLKPNDPRAAWEMGKRLQQAGKNAEAVDKFIEAVEKDPSFLDNDFYIFQRAVTASKSSDKAYQTLMKIDLQQIQPHYISQMFNLYRNEGNTPTAAAKAFLEHMLKKAPVEALGSLFREIRNNKELAKTDAMFAAVKRVFESDLLYDTSGPFFRNISYSSGGTIYGSMQPCMEILRENKAAADAVQTMLTKRREDENSRPMANLLTLVLDIQQGAAETLDQEVVGKRIDEAIELCDGRLSQAVWWEVGQILLAKPAYAEHAVTVLEHAKQAAVTSGMNEYEYSIDAKLTDAYVAANQKEKARAGLLKGYQATDHSQQNQYNAGYGDYQELNSFRMIAEKLVKVDAKLDAIRIYSEALSKPVRIQNAERWGSGLNLKQAFETSLANTIKNLSEDDLAGFLTLRQPTAEPADDAAKQGEAKKVEQASQTAFDLVPLVTTIETDPQQTSLAAFVVTRLADSEQGREQLEKFGDELTAFTATNPDDVSVAAMQLLLAIVLEQDSAVAMIDTAAGKVLQQKESTKGSASNSTLVFHSPAAIGLESKDDAIRQAAARLSDSLVKLAIKSERSDVSAHLVMTRVKSGGLGDAQWAAQDLSDLLDSLVPAGDAGAVATIKAAQDSLLVAKLAVEAQAWDVVADSLRRGFGGGPPLRILQDDTSARGAFAIPVVRTRVSSGRDENPEDGIDPLVKQIWDLLEPVVYRDDDQASGSEDESVTTANHAIYAALRDIVLPQSRPGEAFPYAEMFLRADKVRGYSQPAPYPISLSRLLARAAKSAGQDDELKTLLLAKRETVNEKHWIDLLRIHLALVQGSQEEAAAALEEMVSDLKAMKTNTSTVMANELLHIALPMHELFKLSPALAEVESHLISQARGNPALSNAGDMWGWMTRELLKDPAVDKQVSKRAMEDYLEGVRQRYQNSGGDYALRMYNAEMKKLGGAVTEGENWAIAGEILHQTVLQEPGFQSEGSSLAQLAVTTVNATPEEKYQLFSSILFGETDSVLVSTANMFMYDNPPTAFDTLLKDRKRVSDVPIADPDFPIVELSLLAAEAAAKCGASEELAKRFETHIKEPGDEAEAMAGLTWLIAGNHDQAALRLKRVLERVTKTAPDSGASTPMPIVESVFAARALKVDSLRDDAAASWTPILKHAQQRNLSVAASFFNRMAVKAGGTVVEGGAAGSPLEHFLSVQVPYLRCPVSTMTEPLYVIKENVVHHTAGTGHNILMLKYPLEGDFQFSHRNIRRGWGESHNFYGGIAYMAKPHESSVLIRAVAHRNTSNFLGAPTHDDQDNVITLKAAGDTLVMQVNDQDVATDRRTSAMPFVGVVFEHHVIASAADIRLQGNPKIAAKVDLIGEDLRGWHCPIIWGSLISVDLPTQPGQDQAQLLRSRQQFQAGPEIAVWRQADGELRGRGGNNSGTAGGQSHLQYMRPLLDGESFAYKFDYAKGKQEVHPAIGRIVILLRADGVKLRWLGQEFSYESVNLAPLHEVDPDELIGDGKPELIDGGENAVKITVEGDEAIVEVNGKAVCRFGLATDRRFGLAAEVGHTCVVRDATLTGPWPSKMPADVLMPKQ